MIPIHRSNIVLVLVAAGLAVYIVAYERHQLSDADTYERRGQVFPSFVRSEVNRLQIERAGETVVLERTASADEELSEWRLIAPVEAGTDYDAVDSLMVALEYAEERRKITGVAPGDRRAMGLEEPVLEAAFQAATTTVPIRFGSEDPQGGGRYLTTTDPSIVYVVSRDLFEAFDHPASHFRAKELVSPVSMRNAKRVRRTLGGSDLLLERRDGRWWRDDARLASDGAVSTLLEAIGELRALHFGSEGDLENPNLVVEVDSTSREDNKRVTTTIRVGSVCDEVDEEARWVSVEDGVMVCVARNALGALEVPWDVLEDARATSWTLDEVARLTLRSSEAQVSLERAGSEASSSWTVNGEEADPGALEAWSRALRDVVLLSASATTADPAASGVPLPGRTLVVESLDGPTYTLSIGRPASDGTIRVRREGESVVWRAPVRLEELLARPAVTFRSRRPFDAAGATLRALRVERDGVVEVVEAMADGFRVTAPVDAAAHDGAVREIGRQLAALEVERWVSSSVLREHGFDAPAITVQADFGPESDPSGEGTGASDDGSTRRLRLAIGARLEDGSAYGRLEAADEVFVLSNALVERLIRPLVSTDLLATPSESLQSITIGDRHLAEDAQGRLTGPEGRLSQQVSNALRDAVAGLSTRVVGYGLSPAAGFETPRASVTVERSEGTPLRYVVEFGADAEDGRVYARRSDLDVTWTVPAAPVEVLVREF